MKTKINLALDKDSKEKILLEKKVRVLRTVAITFLFLVGSTAIILFILIASSPLPNLRSTEASLLSQMSNLHTKMARHLLIKNEIENIDTLLTHRDKLNLTFTSLQEKLPVTASVEQITIEQKKILMVVSSPSLNDLDNFSEGLRTLTEEQKKFSKVVVDSLGLDTKRNTYELSISIFQI